MTLFARAATRGSAPRHYLMPWTSMDSRCFSDHSKMSNKSEVKLDRGPFASQIDYKSRLQFNAPSLAYPLSGIVCTIGPATNEVEMLIKLIHAGMRVVRLNLSHETLDYHCKSLAAVRQAVKCYTQQMGAYRPVAIALDTRGPEIRTGQIAGGDSSVVQLNRGDCVKLSTNKDLETICSSENVYVDFVKLPKVVKPCDMIFIDDGFISLRVKEVSGADVICEIVNGGSLGSRKGVNLPGNSIDLPSVSEKDKVDLEFGLKHNVDMVFASFIRDKNDVKEIRQALGPKGRHIKVISKIENQQGLQNIDDIIEASDGVMIARGDLGINIPVEEVALAQKSIIAKCNKLGKPAICATQMLESMMAQPRPTRADASDVANAIFDGADSLMLSGETAKGKFPLESVKCMANICAKMESVLWYDHIQSEVRSVIKRSGADGLTSVTSGIAEIASLGGAQAIMVASPCPMVAQLISQNRPRCPIIMLTQCSRVARQSVIFRGIYPIVVEEMANGCTDITRIFSSGIKQMAMMKLIDADKVVTIITVDALEAKKISFRLLTIKHKSTQAKCMETILSQQKKNTARAKKQENIESCKKQSDKTNSAELIEKCEKLTERRLKRKNAKIKKEAKANRVSQSKNSEDDGN